MKINYLVILGMIFVLSCEKSDDPSIIEPAAPNYYPITTGSYWVYDTYSIDSLGNETLYSENDTIRIIGDTTINEIIYKVVLGKEVTLPQKRLTTWFVRDSSEYIVDENGQIRFQSINLDDTLNVLAPDWAEGHFYWYYCHEEYSNVFSSSSMTFDSIINFKQTIIKEGDPESVVTTLDNLYAPNVGRVINQFGYLSGLDIMKQYFEARLVNYYIAQNP